MDWKRIGAVGVAMMLAAVCGTSSARVEIVPEHTLNTGVLTSYKTFQAANGDTEIVGITADQNLNLWNLNQEKAVTGMPLPILTPGNFLFVHDARVAQNGDVVALVGNHLNTNWAGQVYLADLNRGTLTKVIDTDTGIEAVPFTTRKGRLLYGLTADVRDPKGNLTQFRYVIVDVATKKIVSQIQTDFSGSIRLYERAHGELEVFIGGYEVVALWTPRTGNVQKLIQRHQTSQWPRFVTDNQGRELVQVDNGTLTTSGDKTVYYLWSKLSEGKLTLVRTLNRNEFAIRANGKLLVIERTPGSAAIGLHVDQKVTVRDFDTDAVIGEVPVDFAVNRFLFADSSRGTPLAFLAGRTRPTMYVSPGRAVLSDLQTGKVLFTLNTKSDINYLDIAGGRNETLVAQYLTTDEFRRVHVVGLPDGKVLEDASDVDAVSKLLRLPDGRVVTLLGNTTTGEAGFVDWSDNQARTDFAPGVFLKESLPYDYSGLDQAAIAEGRTFLVPTMVPFDKYNRHLVGFRSFHLK